MFSYINKIKLKNNRNRKEAGFTMIEIIISLLILVTGLLGLLALFPVGLQSAGKASNLSQAAILGMYQIDNIAQIYKYDFSNLYSNLEGASGTFDSRPNFTWSTAVQVLDADRLCQVTLSIYWTDRGVIQEEQFITYVSKYE